MRAKRQLCTRPPCDRLYRCVCDRLEAGTVRVVARKMLDLHPLVSAGRDCGTRPHQTTSACLAWYSCRVLQTSHVLSLYPMCGRYLDVHMQLIGRYLALSDALEFSKPPTEEIVPSSCGRFGSWDGSLGGFIEMHAKNQRKPALWPFKSEKISGLAGRTVTGALAARGLDQPPEPQMGPPPPRGT